MEKVKYTKEYIVKASNKIIYNCLSTPSGLSEWFSDDVNIRDDVYTFIWDGAEEKARLLSKKRDELMRFRWLEDEEEGDDYYFEMRIKVDDLTGERALIVTDFAEEDEVEDSGLLWDSQIDKLRQVIGA
jgi:hypothetical protein